jgi:hypothetical protein
MRVETPTQMGSAPGAEHDPPAITGKPRVFVIRLSDFGAACCLAKAPDVETDTVRIGTTVLVSPKHADTVLIAGDDVAASSAPQILIGLLVRRVPVRGQKLFYQPTAGALEGLLKRHNPFSQARSC